MPRDVQLVHALGLAIVGLPAVLVALLGLPSLVWRPLAERTISRLVHVANVLGLTGVVVMIGWMTWRQTAHLTVEPGHWVDTGDYHFAVKFVYDPLSISLVVLTFVLCGTIGAFANRYLHREPGFNRFFVLYAVFLTGMVVTALAGTIETLFAGWELVGLSSALLVAFFHERPNPVRNGLRVWSVYRVSDAGLLLAAVVMHHVRGEGDFEHMLGVVSWTDVTTSLAPHHTLVIGGLLVIAAAGKSALVPFSGWLPRAMEGPTPSSAVFYGALSVHLGAYLLLRVGPLFEANWWLSGLVFALGLTTAIFASLATRVQTDIKCALTFASLAQVGLIVAEIGLGLRYIALIHLLGHACLRTLQFLRAPTLLQDYRLLENAIGTQLSHKQTFWERWFPESVRRRMYRMSLERGYLDAWLTDWIARPCLRLFRTCDRWERRWTDWLSGGSSRESDQVAPTGESLDDLA